MINHVLVCALICIYNVDSFLSFVFYFYVCYVFMILMNIMVMFSGLQLLLANLCINLYFGGNLFLLRNFKVLITFYHVILVNNYPSPVVRLH